MVTRFRLDKVLGDTMSQGELARRSGIGRATVSRIFNNQTTRVDLAVLDRLASELGCAPGDLLEQVRPKRKKKRRV